MSLSYVFHADTPDEFRKQLISYLQGRQADAKRRAEVKNQSGRTTEQWQTRAAVCQEVIGFLTDLKVLPVSTPDVPQASDSGDM